MPNSVLPVPNADSQWSDYSGLYAKGLLQSAPGVPDAASAAAFIAEIDRGRAAVTATPPKRPVKTGGALFEVPGLKLGNMMYDKGRLNGPQGAFSKQLVGPESFTYETKAPPALGSPYYAVELAELYWASLLRDVPFSEFTDQPPPGPKSATRKLIESACADLSKWTGAGKAYYLGPVDQNGKVTPSLLFRGGVPANRPNDFKNPQPAPDPHAYFAGETFGPYLSQLCVIPTSLGAQPLDQKIQTFMPNQDFMLDLASWKAAQNGEKPVPTVTMDPMARHMRCSRDLAAYTRVDELYQAYLIAYLVLDEMMAPKNPGLPYTSAYKNQKPFGSMGGPDISAFLGVVARAAIDAVWWHKWAVHLRARPEAGGGLVHLWKTLPVAQRPQATQAFDATFEEIIGPSLKASADLNTVMGANPTYLLSQAFPEGSPTHPAFPTGHGTVAGACITALKFFFDGAQNPWAQTPPMFPSSDGLGLNTYQGSDVAHMSINGELHKLAHNISFGHGILAGIHWRTDTDESMRLGEAVALKCLDKLVHSYTEEVDAKILLMNGKHHHIKNV